MNIVLLLTICVTGTLSQYAKGPTDEVLRNRLVPGRTVYTLPMDRDGIDGYLAVGDCGELGKVMVVERKGRRERMMVFDCSGDGKTSEWMKRGNIVGEIDYYTARRWGVIGRGVVGVRVCPEVLTHHKRYGRIEMFRLGRRSHCR